MGEGGLKPKLGGGWRSSGGGVVLEVVMRRSCRCGAGSGREYILLRRNSNGELGGCAERVRKRLSVKAGSEVMKRCRFVGTGTVWLVWCAM
ncbi:hypothetical protein K461DRAFT_121163 [Myriangium duriaei CBS 260.36]|uniref:Uncharacterized protein n=1 Tax=Myriangium duriaei CBS 260.36 TaxID=1168546 RepID=A0A9P4J226_9PEZI|nr:hypothetical protein K461DRAFT_121163 [Myriangium duriaei CBS 260.36]